MKTLTRIFTLVLMVVLMVSCGSSRKMRNSGDGDSNAKARYETMLKSEFDFDCLQSKVRYSLGDKSLNGKLYVEHGKRLCMTMSVLGIEVARFEANHDSVTFVSKFNKQYASLPLGEMVNKLGLQQDAGFEVFESLILGRVYVPGKGFAKEGDYKRFAWNSLPDQTVAGQYSGERYELTYVINPDNQLSSTGVAVPSSQLTSVITYDARQTVEKTGSMPSAETLEIKGKGLSLSLGLNIDAPNLGSKGWSSFEATGKYEKVPLLQLVESIKKMK